MEMLFMLVPLIYIIVVIGLVYLLFKIIDGIRRSNLERNEILQAIHEELKRYNAGKQ